MARSSSVRVVALVALAVLILAGAFFAQPRYVADQERAFAAADSWASRAFPAGAAVGARVEAQPTMHGWRVVYRDVNAPCAATSLGCRSGSAGSSQSDETLVYRDAWVCVEYGTGRGYFFGGSFRQVGPVGPNTCKRPALTAAAPPGD